MAAATLTLSEIAFGSGQKYATVAKWARQDGWPILTAANRTLGRAAQYDADVVMLRLAERRKRGRARPAIRLAA